MFHLNAAPVLLRISWSLFILLLFSAIFTAALPFMVQLILGALVGFYGGYFYQGRLMLKHPQSIVGLDIIKEIQGMKAHYKGGGSKQGALKVLQANPWFILLDSEGRGLLILKGQLPTEDYRKLLWALKSL